MRSSSEPYKRVVWDVAAAERRGAGECACVEEYLNDARTVPPTELRTEIWLPCVEDCLDERLGDVRSEFVTSRSCQRDRLLVGLQIRDARRAHRQMLEFDALIRRQLVVTVARDEVDELLTRDVRLGGGILPLNVEQTDSSAATSIPAAWWLARQSVRPQYTLIASFAVVSVSISSL